MSKTIKIIGAGIAGLSAACYAQMNNLNAEIYESHDKAGGLCTSWKRGAYTFDGCIHWLTGSGPNNEFYPLWQELGALKNREIYNPDCFYRFITKEGEEISFFSNADKLQKHWIEISPEDTSVIKEMVRLIKKSAKLKFPMNKPFALFNWHDIFRMMLTMIPFGGIINTMTKTTVKEFAARFKNKNLGNMLVRVINNEDVQLIGLISTLASLHNNSGGYPLGGSLDFAKSLEKRFLDLGGKIHYNSPVKKIFVKDNRACGIILENGQKISGDYIISAADMKTTLDQFLDNKYTEDLHTHFFNHEPYYKSSILVSLGLDMKFGEREDCVGLHLPLIDPIVIGQFKPGSMCFRQYSMDPGMAPQGKTSASILLANEDFEYWEELYKDKKAYHKKKQEILDSVIKNLEHYYPGISQKVEQSDVSTPMTFRRYTGNWKGCYMTWIPTPENEEKIRSIHQDLPGLAGFYMAGMWVMPPGGLPGALKTGRDAIQFICRDENMKFHTSKDI